MYYMYVEVYRNTSSLRLFLHSKAVTGTPTYSECIKKHPFNYLKQFCGKDIFQL